MTLKDTLSKYDFKFKKKFGQNFISDPHLLQKIASAAEITADDIVVEIGPGAGTLTRELANAARAVIAIEIDPELIPIIEENMAGYANFHLLCADALTIDLDELVAEKTGSTAAYKIVANLPYYITTPLVMHFLEQGFHINRIVIMVQKEVAQRFQAAPGTKEYGAVTVALNYYGQVSLAFIVSRHLFTPQPEVDSAVIDIRIYDQKPYTAEDPQMFRRLIKAAFSQRRKTLNNAIKTAGIQPEIMAQAFKDCDIDPKRRGETLSVAEFVALANRVTDLTRETKADTVSPAPDEQEV